MQSYENRIASLKFHSPGMLDLFAGCGGLTLGMQQAGFTNIAAVEFDRNAVSTHALNFHDGNPVHAEPEDITSVLPEHFAAKHAIAEDSVDVIVGGPPCQAYARIGRAKLRDVAGHPEAFKLDPRGNLYLKYLEWVRYFRPLAIVMENVPDALNVGGVNVMHESADALAAEGYVPRYGMLNSAHYGVPQTRERAFLVAVRQEFGFVPSLPEPTHAITLGGGYGAIRANALKGKIANDPYYAETYRPDNNTSGYFRFVSVRDALSDLPKLLPAPGTRSLQTFVPYGTEPTTDYQHAMRRSGRANVSAHVTRYLPRDHETFARMPAGSEYPAAHVIACGILAERAAEIGISAEDNPMEWQALKKSIVPPYSTEKFSSKWWKMVPDMPSKTLLAHLGKDGYSHLHYDSSQGRTLSVREAARLQGFPDDFVFTCAMGFALKQIGNAVPVPVANAIGNRLMSDMLRSAE